MIKQRGYNPDYPEQIDTWRLGEKVPDWLIDRSKVEKIKEDGDVLLDILEFTTGGYELKPSSGQGILVRVEDRNGFVCFGDNRVFSLTPNQLRLLYV